MLTSDVIFRRVHICVEPIKSISIPRSVRNSPRTAEMISINFDSGEYC